MPMLHDGKHRSLIDNAQVAGAVFFKLYGGLLKPKVEFNSVASVQAAEQRGEPGRGRVGKCAPVARQPVARG